MNRPDKAGEPSMEEILASIRQIIADEPSGDPSEPGIEANPLVPQSLASKSTDTPVPLADRLSGVLKGGPLPPTSPLGSKRPLSFDQDLADMFDEPESANGKAVATPKPDIRVPLGLSTPLSNGAASAALSSNGAAPVSAASPTTTAPGAETPATKPPVAELDTPSSSRAASEPLAPPQPFGDAEKPADSGPAKAFSFPPLRKSSFYPPQFSASNAPLPPQASHTVPEAPTGPSLGAPPVSPARATLPELDDLGPVSHGEANTSASVFDGPAVSPASASSPAPSFGKPSYADSKPASSVFDALKPAHEMPDTPFASVAPAASAPAPEPVAAPPFAAQDRPFGGSSSSQPFTAPPPNAFDALHGTSVDATPVPPVESRPVEPPRFADPFAQTLRPGSEPGFGGQPPRYRREPDLSAAAAHSALDALAQGLAASAAASPPAEPASPAIPLTPVFEPEPEVRPQPSMLPATVPQAGSMPVARTLEDAVADMLRPMLQQWVADNMPRIIERALRTEVAKSVKPGNKPPGT